MFFYLGSPDHVRWLSAAQKKQVKARIVSSKTGSEEVREWNWSQVWECFRDPQVGPDSIGGTDGTDVGR